MSSALAIAGVSALLRDLLVNKLIDQEVNGQLGHDVTVTTLPPDRISTGETEPSQLNLFLSRVTPNLGWRNEGLPSRDGTGRRLSRAPLALDLHYLISAYGAAPLHAEILLGYAMQLLHENAMISRKSIRTALLPALEADTGIPDELRALATSGLENQAEVLKITPEHLDAEELSKFWTASQARFRLSAAYLVSVVLIEPDEPARSPLPVLSRNVEAHPNLTPRPQLTEVVPDEKQPVVLLGKPFTLKGHHLGGTSTEVQLQNDRFSFTRPLTPTAGTEDELTVTIAVSDAADFPVGVYRVRAVVDPSGPEPLSTNQLALTLAPEITVLPSSSGPLVGGTASFSIGFRPPLKLGQTASLLLGSLEVAPTNVVEGATSLSFVIPNAPEGEHLVRLRVDGIDSVIVNREKMEFVPDRRITIP
jgi:hypothetical protein